MTDLDNLRAMLDRAGCHQTDQVYWRNDPGGYSVKAADLWSICEDCTTELFMDGQWTGEFGAHFAEDGTIRHVWVGGD